MEGLSKGLASVASPTPIPAAAAAAAGGGGGLFDTSWMCREREKVLERV